MAKTLEAHDKLIREIFEGSYQFEIPDYQRPYAWTTEQATELFDDLYSAMQDTRVSGASSQYFLGSIVLIKNDREPKSSVVDGQQRLSTLTMLFAVLRTVMPDAADDITDSFCWFFICWSTRMTSRSSLTSRRRILTIRPSTKFWSSALRRRRSIAK